MNKEHFKLYLMSESSHLVLAMGIYSQLITKLAEEKHGKKITN